MSFRRILSMAMLLVLMLGLLAACGSQPAATQTPTEGAAAAPTEAEAAPTVAPLVEETEAPLVEETEAPLAEETMTTEETMAVEETMTTEETMAVEETMTTEETMTAEETAGTDETTTAAMALPDVSDLDLGTIKIASQTPLSGPQSALGTGIRNAVELAVEEFAPQLGLDVTLEAFDDQATPDVGASNANTIAADQDIMCIAGHLNSGVALAALPTYQSAGLTMISPANTNVRITDEFGGTAYRVVGRDDVQGAVAGQFAVDEGYTTAYVLHDTTDYGLGVAEFFRETAEAGGIEILGFEGTQEKSVFDSVLNPVLAAQPDVVFWGGIYSEGGPLLKQMREKAIESVFLGTDGLDSSELANLAGDAVVGVQYTTIAGPPSEFPAAGEMAEAYQAKFNQEAPPFSPQGYDAASLCMLAIAQAAEDAGGRPTREQVNAVMQELGPFQGATGEVTFDEKGDRVPSTYFILEVAAADPAEWNQNEIVSKLEIAPGGAEE